MKTCFVCMPLLTEFQDLYRAISDQIRDTLGSQWRCLRADEIRAPGIAAEKIVESLLNARLVVVVVADVRAQNTINPNVMYELGIAHSFRRPTIVIADKRTDLPFNIRSVETILLDFSEGASLIGDLKKQLQASLRDPEVLKDIDGRRIARNPITAQLRDTRIFLEDLQWLWGYCEVLRREQQAKTVWEITRDLYWETEALFFTSLKTNLQLGKKYYFMVENDDGVLRKVETIKNALHQDLDIGRQEIEERIHFVAIDRSYFVLWPIAVVLYDADLATHGGGIICEPMQSQVGDDHYDRVVQELWLEGSCNRGLECFQRELMQMNWTERRKEATFDIALDRRVVEKLATSFAKIWNDQILDEAQRMTGEDKAALLAHWLIGG